ncbi:heme NO-binding protein [Scytonema sp. UIC 10036]|uniref:heme NO-binding domain-containing protein n=1 Tax=Scytonema sp. UIC 10036 TaxID=2304196 RepID=UPI0012DAB2CB|nr:heme NO-binding domain-containing protein [Scytonema sp. UIC 10036]MUG99894.1 heme NO-binding protein [Scytonema sp. UIC 10036]
MYGLVNKAIQNMVCSRFGEDIWETIKHKAEVNIDAFISMESYPDDVTHRLVYAASLVLEISPQEILQAFGEYWVLYTATEGYGQMLEMAGSDLSEFLHNLDNLHARVGLSFPNLKPPSFECTEMDEDIMQLNYQSTREGLSPMVLGLVKGLGTRFNTEVEIVQTQNRDEGFDHDEFSIRYKKR